VAVVPTTASTEDAGPRQDRDAITWRGLTAVTEVVATEVGDPQVHFRPRQHGPESLVGEVEVHFEEGPLAGTRLLGFGLWRSAQGEVAL
jgi:hypothetical protein